MAERAENVYHVTGQNLHFAHTPYNKNKELKIVGNEWTDSKSFRFGSDLIWTWLGRN